MQLHHSQPNPPSSSPDLSLSSEEDLSLSEIPTKRSTKRPLAPDHPHRQTKFFKLRDGRPRYSQFQHKSARLRNLDDKANVCSRKLLPQNEQLKENRNAERNASHSKNGHGQDAIYTSLLEKDHIRMENGIEQASKQHAKEMAEKNIELEREKNRAIEFKNQSSERGKTIRGIQRAIIQLTNHSPPQHATSSVAGSSSTHESRVPTREEIIYSLRRLFECHRNLQSKCSILENSAEMYSELLKVVQTLGRLTCTRCPITTEDDDLFFDQQENGTSVAPSQPVCAPDVQDSQLPLETGQCSLPIDNSGNAVQSSHANSLNHPSVVGHFSSDDLNVEDDRCVRSEFDEIMALKQGCSKSDGQQCGGTGNDFRFSSVRDNPLIGTPGQEVLQSTTLAGGCEDWRGVRDGEHETEERAVVPPTLCLPPNTMTSRDVNAHSERR